MNDFRFWMHRIDWLRTRQRTPPPEVRILSLELGKDVVLSSTLIPDWSLQAEFATNLHPGEWSVLPIATNRVSSNRIDSICGRPEGDSILIRLKASR